MTEQAWGLIALCGGMLLVLIIASIFTQRYSLNRIKSKTVGDGQHGTARWATPKEIRKTYVLVPFQVEEWRRGENRPETQGIVLGCIGRASVKAKKHSKHGGLKALVDCDDVHFLMIGASGVGKTAFFLYPNLEYACACGMSFLALDTKGDLARNYGAIASKYYGYKISVIDLRNPTRSDGNNLLTLINRYMDLAKEDPSNLAARAKAEKYAKILAKTIVNPDGDASSYGQNAFFYDAAEGLLTAVVLLLAEYLSPTDKDFRERRHIVSVFKLVQDLLESPGPRQKSYFQQLMGKLPENHKAKWFAGAALNTSDQAMASVMSTVLSRLNAFLDSELEQVICFDSAIDAETFASEKCAIFLILPEEDTTKNFMAGLMIQNLSRELFAVADENGGKLKNRVVLFCDELGTMPPFDMVSSACDDLKDKINHVFNNYGVLVSAALAYDAKKINEALTDPSLPAQIGAGNREQMLKMLGLNINSAYTRQEQCIVRFVMSFLKFNENAVGNEMQYLSALWQLGRQINWSQLGLSTPSHTTSLGGSSVL